jgi:ubiquitin carboxyl-terminal hydrolase 7
LVARLQVHEKDWAKYRFALIQEATFKQPTHISDGELILGFDRASSLRIAFTEDILYDHKWLAEDVLGLDHMDKSNKRTNGAYKNDAIVIKG